MVETRNGGERERSTAPDSTRSADLQLIHEEVELTKLKFETLARNERTTTTRLDSMEKKIEAMATDSSARFESIEKQMSFITDVLKRLDEAPIYNQRQGKAIASTSDTPHIEQIPILSSETEISPTQLGYRGIHGTLENRDKMLKKIEMPMFSGSLPFDWISRVERFFRFGQYNEEEKLYLVSLSLEGSVLQWFNGELLSDPFASWEQFTQRLLDRFGGPIDNDPAARLFCLKQEGEIEDYVSEFESLRNQVTGVDEKNLIKVFFNGLKPDMKEVIRMKEPVTLTQHKLAVLKMQSTTFCRVIRSAAGEGRGGYQRQSSGAKVVNYNNKPLTEGAKSESTTNKENLPPQRNNSRPRLMHTNEELDQMRKDKICFKCKASWSPAHKMECPNRMLRVLTVLNGLELEVVDSVDEEVIQEQPQQQILHTLSLNSYLGIDSPKTTKMRGYINNREVIVMLDSGASHNFISPEVVSKLQLKVSVDRILDVLLGNGVTVNALGVCQAVTFQLNKTNFKVTSSP